MKATRELEPLAQRAVGFMPCLMLVRNSSTDTSAGSYSGFLVEESGSLFWITARHVVEDHLLKHGKDPSVSARFYDTSHHGIPVVLADFLDKRVLYDCGEHPDLAVFQIPDSYADPLRRGPRFSPFHLEDLVASDDLESWCRSLNAYGPPSFWIAGYPKDCTTSACAVTADLNKIKLSITAKPVLVPLRGLANRNRFEQKFTHTASLFWRGDCYYSEAPKTLSGKTINLNTIQGMSGGPVIGEVEGKTFVFGVQSSWLPDSHVVRVVPIDGVKCLLSQFRKFVQDREQTHASK